MDVFEKYFDLIHLGHNTRKFMFSFFSKKTNQNISEFSSAVSARSIQAKTLVIHDENGRELEVFNAINIDKKLKRGKLLITKGLGHRRILRDERVIDQIVNFLRTD